MYPRLRRKTEHADSGAEVYPYRKDPYARQMGLLYVVQGKVSCVLWEPGQPHTETAPPVTTEQADGRSWDALASLPTLLLLRILCFVLLLNCCENT